MRARIRRKGAAGERGGSTKRREGSPSFSRDRRAAAGGREEINADCYSRNLMRSHLPGTWPALLCVREREKERGGEREKESPRVRSLLLLFVEMTEETDRLFFLQPPRPDSRRALFYGASPPAGGDFNDSSLGPFTSVHGSN